MSTDLGTLRGLAHRARLEFDATREQQMLGDLNNILDFVAQLEGLDTTGVEPLVHLSQEINVLRDDEARNTVNHQEGLRNAPARIRTISGYPKCWNNWRQPNFRTVPRGPAGWLFWPR